MGEAFVAFIGFFCGSGCLKISRARENAAHVLLFAEKWGIGGVRRRVLLAILFSLFTDKDAAETH